MRAIFGASKKSLIIIPIFGLASFCVSMLFFSANFAYGASKPKASAGPDALVADDQSASKYLAPVSDTVKDFYKSLGMARGILSWVEARTEEFRKNAPMPQKNLEPLRQGLGFTGKTGLKPALRVVEQETHLSLKELSGIPSQARGINTLAAGTKRLGWSMGQADKLRERAQVLAKEADAGLIGLRDALLKLDERAKAQRAENYRRQLVPGLGVIAKSLEGGLKRKALSPPGLGARAVKPLIALAASEPREECPPSFSAFDECGRRFEERKGECDRAPDLLEANKCLNRLINWRFDVCPGEMKKEKCNLVCGKDQELKAGRCEPKAPPKPPTIDCAKVQVACLDDCPRNLACSDIQAIFKHEEISDKLLRRQINDGLSLEAKTTSGKKTFDAFLKGTPGEGKYDFIGLSKAGVVTRLAEKNAPNRAQVYWLLNSETGKKEMVLSLRPDLFKGTPGAIAPVLGHEISHMDDIKRDRYSGSRVRTEQKALLQEIYISRELEKQGKFCTAKDTSVVCQGRRLNLLIWKSGLKNQNAKKLGFTDPKVITRFGEAKRAEMSGFGGTKFLLDDLNSSYNGFDKGKTFPWSGDKEKDPIKALRAEDEAYRKADITPKKKAK